MPENRYVVPEGMLKAVHETLWYERWGYKEPMPPPNSSHWVSSVPALMAAIKWLAENPITPTLEQTEEMRRLFHYTDKPLSVYQTVAVEWQRRMFLAPESPTHPELERWILDAEDHGWEREKVVNLVRIFERAYQLGREDGAKNGRV